LDGLSRPPARFNGRNTCAFHIADSWKSLRSRLPLDFVFYVGNSKPECPFGLGRHGLERSENRKQAENPGLQGDATG